MSETINGRYVIQNEIGSGGMGIVYRAHDRLTGMTVALKRVRLNAEPQIIDSRVPHDTQEQLRLVLAKEFQILAGLRHPNIISVIDYGFDSEQQPFYTMTFLEESQTILEAGAALDQNGKLDLLEQLLQGLAYLHRRGILHRDIKPANVLVTGGMVKLLDFGLSHAADEDGAMGGSPLYMSPELMDGEEATIAADLYAVGVLFYQLFVGKHPFGEFDTGFYRRMSSHSPNLTAVDYRLHPLLHNLLDRTPAGRSQSAQEVLQRMAEALGHLLSAETEEIRESYLQAATFVGRQPELGRLKVALDEAKAGVSSAWLIGGESGVGKSRLLDEIRVTAMVNGWQVLNGQAVEGGGLPYQLWREIVPRLLLNSEVNDLEAGILKEIVPNIEDLLGRTVPPLPFFRGAAGQERLSNALFKILLRQRKKTILLLEDLHWADKNLTTLILILKMLHRFPGLMIVGTYRRDERSSLPVELPNVQTMMLERLGENEVRQLSQAMLGDQADSPDISSLLIRETEGNTFFIVEVMRSLAEEAGRIDEISQLNLPSGILTAGMETLLHRRFQRIATRDRPLLEAAAIAGRQLDLPILAELAPHIPLEGWLQRVSETSILTVVDNKWRFSHDKLRETIVNTLSLTSRQRLHRQVAEAIERVYPADEHYHQALLDHWHQVGDTDKVIDYVDSVARYLIKVKADYVKADRILEESLKTIADDDLRRVSLLNWWSEALFELEGEEHFERAIQLAQQSMRLAEKVEDHYGLVKSLALCLRGLNESDEQTERYVQRALNIAQTIDDQHSIANILYHLGLMYFRQGKLNEAQTFCQRSVRVWEDIDDQVGLGLTLDQLGQICLPMGEYEKAGASLKRSYETFKAGGLEHQSAWSLLNLGRVPMATGDFEYAADLFQQSMAIFEKFENQAGMGFCLLNLSVLAKMRKAYAEATSHLSHSLMLLEKINLRIGIGFVQNNFGWLAFLQGDIQQALTYLEESLSIFQELGDKRSEADVLSRQGIVYATCGQSVESNFALNQALIIASANQLKPLVLDIVLGFAWLKLLANDPKIGGEWVGMVSSHPTFNQERQDWLDLVYQKAASILSPSELAVRLEAGKNLDLDQVIEELLDRVEMISKNDS